MAFIQAEIKILEMQRTINTQLYFPTDLPESVGNKIKGVITLLHGFTNTGADWMMMSSACRYAADNGYVLVAPNADNSFYTDMHYGSPFYTCITQFLPMHLRRIFKLPDERDKNFIAGLSMGGYGALRVALTNPDKYAACGSFSGSVDLQTLVEQGKGTVMEQMMTIPIFGNIDHIPDEANLLLLAKQVATLPKEQQPRIYCSVGRQDGGIPDIYAQNQTFRTLAKNLPLDYKYQEWDGVHEWNFWDRSLAEFIGFIQNSNYSEKKRADWASL